MDTFDFIINGHHWNIILYSFDLICSTHHVENGDNNDSDDDDDDDGDGGGIVANYRL